MSRGRDGLGPKCPVTYMERGWESLISRNKSHEIVSRDVKIICSVTFFSLPSEKFYSVKKMKMRPHEYLYELFIYFSARNLKNTGYFLLLFFFCLLKIII